MQSRGAQNSTLITNYPTHEAMALCSGGMIERGASMQAIASWAKMKCGLDQGPCLLDYHVDHGTGANFVRTLAPFLIGVYKYAYFGVGEGWGGPGAGACSAWLQPYPEYEEKLGEPKGLANATNTTNGMVYTREFASGTKVFVGQYLAPCSTPKNKRCQNSGACIFWSSGRISGNATECPPGGGDF